MSQSWFISVVSKVDTINKYTCQTVTQNYHHCYFLILFRFFFFEVIIVDHEIKVSL